MSYPQQIYNRLRQNGLTEAAALGILGNFQCESGCEPNRLQGDFSPYRTASKQYVADVTSGKISRESFSRDAKGFGLYQLTYWSRKQGYYDFWKMSGQALDSATLQTDYALIEMRSDYPQLYAFLKSTTDVFTATSRICREFERPAVNNIDARYQAANKFKYELDLNNWEDGGDPDPDPQPSPEPAPQPAIDHSLILRTIDHHCELFHEYDLLVSLLVLRKYSTTDVWASVKQFQTDNGLVPDGIVGNLTWAKLLDRG